MATSSPPSEAEARIHIIGPVHMQNRLLCSFLQDKTGAACRIWESLEEIQSEQEGQVVVLCDCQGRDVKQLLEEIQAVSSAREHRVLLFNVGRHVPFDGAAVHLGICGFLYEHESFDNLPKAIRAVLNGELWLSRAFMSRWIISSNKNGQQLLAPDNGLTPKETEILQLVAQGATNREIAEKLLISCNTAKSHVYNIFKKINVNNRVQASIWAREHLAL